MRDNSEAEIWSHKSEVVGSSPTPATKNWIKQEKQNE